MRRDAGESGLAGGDGVDRGMDGTSADMWGGGVAPGGEAERGAWLRQSRFALFVHWGVYSELAGEWAGQRHFGIAEWIMNRARIPVREYEAVAGRFNPSGFDAVEWVRLAKAAGMRHIMITAKHHDGFAMFRSAVSPYNIADATPFGRDPLKELADACRAEGIRLGFYYSQTQDWHDPDAVGNSWDPSFPAKRNFQRYLRGKAMPQIEELLTHYGPVAGIWFDTPGPITPDESRELVDLVHRLQPDCLVNSRIGNGLGDYDTLGDQEIPRLPRSGLWETPDTHNDTWAYSRFDTNWKSAREVAERLVRVVSRGGTYLLNVGPDGKGRIPSASARILLDVGKWVAKHEAAIHGAAPSPLAALPWGECTRRGNCLYLHVFHWPRDGRLAIPGLQAAAVGARLNGRELSVETSGDVVTVRVPREQPDDLIPVVELSLSGPIQIQPEAVVFSGFSNGLDAGVAVLDGCEHSAARWMEKFGDWKHEECIGGWSADGGSSAAWEFRTIGPGSFHVDIAYTCAEDADYSEWVLETGTEDLVFPLIDTGERSRRAAFGGSLPRFRTYRIGWVDLPGPGRCRLVLRPLDARGSSVRVAGLTLVPAE